MPELPEVETVRAGLEQFIVGQIIESVDFDWSKGFPNDKKLVDTKLVGSTIESVQRRGKAIIIPLSSGYSLLIHLKMTGQLVYRNSGDRGHESEIGRRNAEGRGQRSEDGKQITERQRAEGRRQGSEVGGRKTDNGKAEGGRQKGIQGADERGQKIEGFGGGHPSDSLISKLPDKSTRVIFTLTDGILFFNDQRKFGYVKLEKTEGLHKNNAFLAKLGPEPLEDNYKFEQFRDAVRKRQGTTIKAAILDQTVVAGVGNIYADEGLFAARIHPATRVTDVSTIKLHKLYDGLREVMKLSIKLGGSSDRNYVDAKGKKGSYLKFAKVFRREGQNCPECGGEIVKIRVAGRGTHICTKCQKLPKR